ncbi:hypothetical protein GCM10010286_62350 [Streptomyces toxytricini]|nr:hypothetical protein GCM10010286_62350 [Streptomyces toxytricini]
MPLLAPVTTAVRVAVLMCGSSCMGARVRWGACVCSYGGHRQHRRGPAAGYGPVGQAAGPAGWGEDPPSFV